MINPPLNCNYQVWWVDGVDQGTLTGLDNYNLMADLSFLFRVGATTGIDAGTSGTFYLDELVANDDGSVIGAAGPSASVSPSVSPSAIVSPSASVSPSVSPSASVSPS